MNLKLVVFLIIYFYNECITTHTSSLLDQPTSYWKVNLYLSFTSQISN